LRQWRNGSSSRGKKGRDQVAKDKKEKKTRWSVVLWIVRKVCPAG
jgi:hypothetical protein